MGKPYTHGETGSEIILVLETDLHPNFSLILARYLHPSVRTDCRH